MDILSAKLKIGEAISRIAEKLQALGLLVKTEIYIEDSDFERCDRDVPKKGFVTGDVSVYTPLIAEDDGLVLECSVEFKGDNVSDKAIEEEIEGFNSSVEEFLLEISSQESPEEYLSEYIRRCDADAEEMVAKFDKQINSIKLAAYVAGAVAVVVVLLCVLLGALF